MFFMFLIIKLDSLNVNMFFKIFFKKIFSYIPGRNFSRFTTRATLRIYAPGIFLSLLHVIYPCCVNFHVFSNNSHKCINMHMQDSCQKSEFTECGNLYNYFHLIGIKFAYKQTMYNYKFLSGKLIVYKLYIVCN